MFLHWSLSNLRAENMSILFIDLFPDYSTMTCTWQALNKVL